MSERDSDFLVSEHPSRQPGPVGPTKGGGTGGLLEMPSCFGDPVFFAARLAFFRELGKSQM